MTPSQIAKLITEDVNDNNGVSREGNDTVLITTPNIEVILRIPPRTPKEYVLEILNLNNPKNANYDNKLLEQIKQHWSKIHPPGEVIYEISIAPRGTNNFNFIGMAYVHNDVARVKLIGEVVEQPWMVKEVSQAIKKLDVLKKRGG